MKVQSLVVSAKARNDIETAYEWYEGISQGLGDKLVNQIEFILEAIFSFLGLYSITFQNYRQASIKGFPYVLIYLIEGDTIVVESLFHTSRDPDEKFQVVD